MPINQQRLQTKLDAIRSKDVAALVAAQIDIPFLSRPYTGPHLQAWLDKRIARLEEVATWTDAEIIALRDTLYNGLNNPTKPVADAIIAKQNFTFPSNLSGANYDRLVGIILITFVLD